MSLRRKPSRRVRAESEKMLRAAARSAVRPILAEPLEPRCLLSATLLTTLSTATSSDPVTVVNVNGTAYCASTDNGQPNTTYLWKSDGTTAGTSLLKTFKGYVVGPTELTASGGKLYFTAMGAPGSGGFAYRQLFVSDGTQAGTVALTNFIASGTPETNLTDVNGTLYFLAPPTGANGTGLWKTNGTVAGTVQVFAFPSDPTGNTGVLGGTLQNVNGTLYFAASDGTHGDELWKSDGTAAGTFMVDDIDPGKAPGFNGNLTYVNGTIFFTGDDGTHGDELWTTDGTTAGTVMVKDINPIGAIPSIPQDLTPYNGELYFIANDGTHGYELWKSDGTDAGTVMVDDINPGSADSSPSFLTVSGGSLYFSADDGTHGDELWKTDGTAAGTVMVRDINPGLSAGQDGSSSSPELLTDSNGRLFFTANDGSHGWQIWTSDGTAAGTRAVTNLGGTGNQITFIPEAMVGNRLIFIGNDGAHGQEVWASDGTAAGTMMLRDIMPGGNSSQPHGFVNVGGKVVFAATDAISGTQLWGTDGTPGGTSTVKALTLSINGTSPQATTAQGNHVVFDATIAGRGIWTSDGTPAGTKALAPGSFMDAAPVLLPSTGELIFSKSGNLWETDGTAAGTVEIKALQPILGQSTPSISDLTVVGDRVYFSGTDTLSGDELWTSDGTAAGTYMVADVVTGLVSSAYPQNIIGVNGNVFFESQGTLFKTDGGAGGTAPISSPNEFQRLAFEVDLGGVLIFEATPNLGTPGLWRSDGTTAGTVQIAAASSVRPAGPLVIMNGQAYFMSYDVNGNQSLWKTDGTDAGTTEVYAFGAPGFANGLINVNGTLYMPGPNGNSLWKSDGTTAGTVQVQSFTPASQGVQQFVNADGRLYFLDNSQVYTSDGTAAGTVQVDDSPDQATQASDLVALGDQVFFQAQSANYGAQLWVITPPTAPPAPGAPANLTATAASGGEIDLAWSADPGALTFQLQRSADPSFATIDKTITLQDPSATQYVDTTVAAGATYYYRLAASNRGGQSAFSTTSATTPAAPAAPSALTANGFYNHVDLSWTDNSSDETSFRIDRSASPDFSHIDATFTVPANVTSFSDTSVTDLNSYCYRVSAVNAAGVSGGATTHVFTPDLPPASLIATRVSPTEVDLQWANTSTTEFGYRILRAVAGGTPVQYAGASPGATTYNDLGASANISYTYIVEAYDAYGASDSPAATCLSVVPQFTNLVAQLPNVSLPESESNPSAIVMSGGVGYFSATDQSDPMGLFRTDGTEAGTSLVAPIQADYNQQWLNDLTDVNGTLYFVAYDPNIQQGIALWKSNGTASGTMMVRDLSPESLDSSNIHDLTNFNGTLYFRGGGRESGAKSDALWKSNGTAAGTVLVKDFPIGDGYPNENGMIDVNGKLFLSAGAASGNALYVSDGTAAGTTQVLPGAPAMSITGLTQVGNGVYFMDSVSRSIWYSDGTAAGTFEVPNTSDPFGSLTDVNGTLYFVKSTSSGYQLWATDGTAAGTNKVADLPQFAMQIVQPLANLNGKCVFTASTGPQTSVEITDGTTAGTSIIGTYAFDPTSTNITDLTVYNGAVYYAVPQSANVWTLYESNGAPGSAVTLGSFTQKPTHFSIANGVLTFTGAVAYSSLEPWRTDGTPAGTYMIKNVGYDTWTQQPDWMTNVNGTVFFASTSAAHTGPNSAYQLMPDTPAALWKTDGTSAGTSKLADVAPSNLVAVGNTLYFSGLTQASGTELWKSDGTVAGTVMVKDIVPGAASSGAMPLANLGGILLFGVPAGTPGDYQLWRSDGTDAGTYQVSPALLHLYYVNEFYPSPTGPDFAVSNGVFYFVGKFAGTGDELWRSDGTAAGTSMVSDILPGSAGSDPSDFVDVNGTLYFTALDPTQSGMHDLYKSDGTAAGTAPIAMVGSLISSITNVNGTIFFAGTDAAHGAELWKSDGTSAQIVSDIVPGTTSSFPYDLTAVGKTLYFLARNAGDYNHSLYKSDGTAAGTVPIRAFEDDPVTPAYLLNGNGVLFYSDGAHLWSSDGTLAGTQNVMTISDVTQYQLPIPSAGSPYALLGNTLLFSSWNASTNGRDLRAVTTIPPLPPTSLLASAPGGTGGTGTGGTGATPAFRPDAMHAAINFSASTSAATLTWQNPAKLNAVGLIVDRSTSANFSTNLISKYLSAGATQYTDSGLVPGTRYYYRVRAINGAGITSSNVAWLVISTNIASLSATWGAGTAVLSTAADGLHLLPSGRKTDVPWTGLSSFTITLANPALLASGDVTVSSAAGINYGPITITGSGSSYKIMLAHPVTSADRLTITISNAGITTFKRELDVLPGDANDDGVVNFADFVILSSHFGHTYVPPAWSLGDFNGDNAVTSADFTTLAADFGKSLPALPAIAPLAARAAKPATVRAPIRVSRGSFGK